jgi:hypothetical protein
VPAAGPADKRTNDFAPLFGAAHPSRPRRTGPDEPRARRWATTTTTPAAEAMVIGSKGAARRAHLIRAAYMIQGTDRCAPNWRANQSAGGLAARARRVGWASRAPTPGPGTASAEPSHVCTADLATGNEPCYREQKSVTHSRSSSGAGLAHLRLDFGIEQSTSRFVGSAYIYD